MIYLIDTIAFNKYYEYKNNQTCDVPKNINIVELVNLLSNANANGDKVWVHSATMYELFIRCYRNNKVQEEYRNKNQFNLGQFADAYQFLVKENHFRIMNERPYYFQWEQIVEYYNDEKYLNIDEFIKIKMEMELNFLHIYIISITTICSLIWFEKYKDTKETEYMNDESWMNLFTGFMGEKINLRIKDVLKDYYYNFKKKESVKNEIDFLLGYVLDRYEYFIKHKFAKNADALYNEKLLQEKFNRLNNYIVQINKEEILSSISGAERAKEVMKSYKKQLDKYIGDFLGGALDKLPAMTKISKQYIVRLFKDTLLQGTKISKNDASDYLIISAGDLERSEEKIVLITYDKKMKKFLEDNHVFYDKKIYSKVYND